MFESRTAEQIKRHLVEAVAANTGLTGEDGGFLDHLLGPVAMELWSYYQALDATLPIAFVDESSGGYIDRRCEEYGLTRKPGAKALAVMTLTGKAGTTVPKDTAFLSTAGLEFDLMADVILTGGTDKGKVEAVAEGTDYNVEAGSLTQMVVTLPGLETWTNAAAMGGADQETDAALVGRLNAYLQKPATSGNVYHYERWALEVMGVGACRVTPLWAGPGTVKVLLVGQEMEPVDATVVAAAAANIEEQRPIGATVTVKSAQGLAINVAAKVTVAGSTTPEQVKETLGKLLEEYLKSVAFVSDAVLYNRVGYLLLGIEGVSDYTALTLNGGTRNVAIGAEQVPVLGEVAIS